MICGYHPYIDSYIYFNRNNALVKQVFWHFIQVWGCFSHDCGSDGVQGLGPVVGCYELLAVEHGFGTVFVGVQGGKGIECCDGFSCGEDDLTIFYFFYTGNIGKASSFSIVCGVSVFETKKYVAGVYNIGHIFADLEGIFDDLVHFLFCFASFFVHLVEKEGGCFFYKVGGCWCVYARSYAKGFDFFWEDGDDLDVGCVHVVLLSGELMVLLV